jgi:hypothetical protein
MCVYVWEREREREKERETCFKQESKKVVKVKNIIPQVPSNPRVLSSIFYLDFLQKQFIYSGFGGFEKKRYSSVHGVA